MNLALSVLDHPACFGACKWKQWRTGWFYPVLTTQLNGDGILKDKC